MSAGRVLLVDDERNLRRVLQIQLEEEGFEVLTAASADAALAAFDRSIDAVVTDIRMPGTDGLALLDELKRRDANTVVIVMTAHGDVEQAVRSLKSGAFDFLTKPVSRETLTATVTRAVNFSKVYFQAARQREELQSRYSFQNIVGASSGMKRAFDLVARAAPRDMPVLIRGETGTGKELIARALHHASGRADGPFVELNCAAIPDSLMESAFFGHEKGAFTGATATHIGAYEEAHRGTLLLDELGLLKPELQGKLLRVLETGIVRRLGAERDRSFDVRVVAATNSPLEEMVAEGSFREDLYYRLNVLEVRLPPLREREGDLPLLVDRLLVDLDAAHVTVDEDAIASLNAHSWPGNVRELRNVLERALILRGHEDRISSDDLELRPGPQSAAVSARPAVDPTAIDTITIGSDGIAMDDLERRLLELALTQSEGNRSRAARFLGLGRHAFLYRLKKHGLADREDA